jgi:putative ABC transport system permease protein
MARDQLSRLGAAAVSDVRHAVRRLVRVPGFSSIAIATLALAIGAGTAIFCVVDAVLLNTLAHPHADRLVSIAASAPGSDLRGVTGVGAEFYLACRTEADKLEDAGIFTTVQTTARTKDRVDRPFMVLVTSSVFTTLSAKPHRGRLPTAEDEKNHAPVMVISHALWQDWFGGDEAVIGTRFEVGGIQREVIGVMEPAFRFPDSRRSIWVLMPLADKSRIRPGSFNFGLVGRMTPGTRHEDLAAQLAIVARRLPDRWGGPAEYRRMIELHQPVVRSLKEVLVGTTARPLWILFGAVGIVFLIACANVANLFMVRAEGRSRELAVRLALGASRGELIRSMMAEAFVLAAVGGVLGAFLAWAGLPALVRAAPEGVPNIDLVALNAMPLLFATGLVILAALAFGLAPAISFSRTKLVSDLHQVGRGSGGGSARGRFVRNALVVVQTASAVVLLVGAGLLARSFWNLSRVDLGFDTKDVLTFQVAPSGPDFTDGYAYSRFHQGLIDRLRVLPGVQGVGLALELPLDEGARTGSFSTEHTIAAGMEPRPVNFVPVGGDYFEVMKIPVTSGRLFTAEEQRRGSANILVSQKAADLFWPRENPIGKRLNYGDAAATGLWQTVIGVVGDVRLQSSRQQTPDPMVYFPMAGPQPRSWGVGSPAYVIKTTRAETIAPDVRAALHQYAPSAPMYRISTLEGLAGRSTAQLSFTMLLIAIAAVLSTVLGAVGVFGVLSYVVAQRRTEIAVRMALGAQASSVRRLVVLQGGRVAMVGVALGILAALGLTGIIDSMLFGVQALDATTFVAMSALMIVIAFVSSYVPARRASSVDPMDALRAD